MSNRVRTDLGHKCVVLGQLGCSGRGKGRRPRLSMGHRATAPSTSLETLAHETLLDSWGPGDHAPQGSCSRTAQTRDCVRPAVLSQHIHRRPFLSLPRNPSEYLMLASQSLKICIGRLDIKIVSFMGRLGGSVSKGSDS